MTAGWSNKFWSVSINQSHIISSRMTRQIPNILMQDANKRWPVNLIAYRSRYRKQRLRSRSVDKGQNLQRWTWH